MPDTLHGNAQKAVAKCRALRYTLRMSMAPQNEPDHFVFPSDLAKSIKRIA